MISKDNNSTHRALYEININISISKNKHFFVTDLCKKNTFYLGNLSQIELHNKGGAAGSQANK
jgi:hypothetical protein